MLSLFQHDFTIFLGISTLKWRLFQALASQVLYRMCKTTCQKTHVRPNLTQVAMGVWVCLSLYCITYNWEKCRSTGKYMIVLIVLMCIYSTHKFYIVRYMLPIRNSWRSHPSLSPSGCVWNGHGSLQQSQGRPKCYSCEMWQSHGEIYQLNSIPTIWVKHTET